MVLVDFGISSRGGGATGRLGHAGIRRSRSRGGCPAQPGRRHLRIGRHRVRTAQRLRTGRGPIATGEHVAGQPPATGAARRGLAIDPDRRPTSACELVERLRARHEGDLPMGVITFMLTDIEGSTAMWDANPAQMAGPSPGTRCWSPMRSKTTAAGSSSRPAKATRPVGVQRATDAVPAAVAVQRALGREPWPEGVSVRARIALHTGRGRAARRRLLRHGGQPRCPSACPRCRRPSAAVAGDVVSSSPTNFRPASPSTTSVAMN